MIRNLARNGASAAKAPVFLFQWMKVDELIEQERQVKSAMSSRSGIMALMMHSTFNHDVVSLQYVYYFYQFYPSCIIYHSINFRVEF